jgi:putative membrane protein
LVVAGVRDGGLTLVRDGDDLILRRGLLGRRESSVPLRRVQVVRVAANPLRRALGVAQLRIHSAGGSAGTSSSTSGRGGDGRAVIPLIDVDDVERLVARLLPALETLPALEAHPPAALRRARWRRLRGLLGWAVPAGVGWWSVVRAARDGVAVPLPERLIDVLDVPWTVAVAIAVLLVALQFTLARAEFRTLGHGLGPTVLVARRGVLTHVTSVAPLERLQAVTLRWSWFQARRDLATVSAHVAGPSGDVTITDMAADGAARLRVVLAGAAAGATVDRPLSSPAGR